MCHLNHRGVRVSFRESQYFAKWPGGIQRKRQGSARSSEILQGDWVALLPAPARQSVPQLSDQEKATRLDRVKTALGASDPTVVVDALAADSNVLFIIEKRLCYDDV
jgi:hypothetical protein